MSNQRIVGLITDFGSKGQHYVASMKGVIFQINPECKIVDICHDITPFSILEASYVLKSTREYFPECTIFIIVVDPGVGSNREILAIKTNTNQYYIGPNNGLFHFLSKDEILECVELNNDNYHHKPVSTTFHGRDIMAPIAAHLSKDIPLNKLGDYFHHSVKRLNFPLTSKNNIIEGIIQYIDSFGNVITNIPINKLELVEGMSIVLNFQKKTFKGLFVSYFKSAPSNSLVFIKGSSNYIEISINKGNAADLIGFKVGDIIQLIVKEV